VNKAERRWGLRGLKEKVDGDEGVAATPGREICTIIPCRNFRETAPSVKGAKYRLGRRPVGAKEGERT